MRWHYDGKPWVYGKRLSPWDGDTGALGAPLPDDRMQVAASAGGRAFHLFCYSPDGGDFRLDIPFKDVEIEGGALSLPTRQIDVQGPVFPTWGGGLLRLWGKGWGGDGQPGYLYRVYTWVTLVP
jgi:hypothetical protein